jgi:pimeloyl-ACP methyl ester carboxylesterase
MKSQRIVDVGEARLECTLYGTGVPLVLLPNAGCSTSYCDHVARVLADAGFQIVAINMRGVGASQGPCEGLTLHDFAADVAGVIAALDCAPAHVLGHAFGNRVARCLAADRPDLVRRVILLAAGGLVADPAAASRAPLHHVLRPEMTAAERVAVLAPYWLAPTSNPTLLLQVECWPELHTAQLASSQAIPLDDWWTGGTAPILVIQGLEDRGAPPSNGYALRTQGGARVQVVDLPQAGHFFMLEHPQAVTDAVIAFLRAREPGEGLT